MGSKILLLPVLGFVLLFTTRADFMALLLLDLTCSVLIPGDMSIGGMSMNSSDLVMGAMAFLLATGHWPVGGIRLRSVPLMRLWVLLGLLLSFSYVFSPANTYRLTDPARIAYQLYRYCWKPLFYYVLVALIVGNDTARARKLVIAVLVLGCYTALSKLAGFVGGGSEGLIDDKNKFAGTLIAPTTVCLTLLLAAPPGRTRTLLSGGLGILGLGLVAAGSRGAVVAAAAATVVLMASLARFAGGRRRIVRLTGWAAAAILAVLIVVPDVGRFAGARQIAELQQGTQVHNLTWRMQERWPYFWNKVLQHPWVGIGSDRDVTLADQANTPHNGYLSLALHHGLPAAILIVIFGLRSTLHARRTFLRRGETEPRILALGVSAAIVALMTHNIVESTIIEPNVEKLFWVLAGLAGVSALLGRRAAVPTATSTEDVTTERGKRRYRGTSIPVRPIVPRV